MCVDFTNLNKACTIDCYSLSRIDGLIDLTIENEILYFSDALKGWHQIGMSEENQEKMAFVTDEGIFCYSTIPFELMNVGASYKHLINMIFWQQIS